MISVCKAVFEAFLNIFDIIRKILLLTNSLIRLIGLIDVIELIGQWSLHGRYLLLIIVDVIFL